MWRDPSQIRMMTATTGEDFALEMPRGLPSFGGVSETARPDWAHVVELGPRIERQTARRILEELNARLGRSEERLDSPEERADRRETAETMFLGQMHSISVRFSE